MFPEHVPNNKFSLAAARKLLALRSKSANVQPSSTKKSTLFETVDRLPAESVGPVKKNGQMMRKERGGSSIRLR